MKKRTSKFWFMKKLELEEIVKSSNSIADICRKLGVSKSGDQHAQIKKVLRERDIDFSHINIGLGSNSGRKFNREDKISLKEILVENSTYSNKNLKIRIFKEGLLENKCSKCNLEPKWNNEPLTLALDHINGVNNDHRIQNLRILCPNCHMQTATWGTKRFKKHYYCEKCNKEIGKTSKSCIECVNIKQRKQQRPSKEQLLKEIKETNFVKVGSKYGVSDNAIRKWLK